MQKIRKTGLRLPNLIISVVFQDAMLCLLLIKCLFIGGEEKPLWIKLPCFFSDYIKANMCIV